ncbi:MAG: AraC family transcriptional regulator [Myxococcaceae bacterium]|nr:AraC family transcriptional regulator [Myxococcaceae bacterium]
MRISVIFARGILSEVRDRGLDPEALMQRSELEPTRLWDLRQTLSLAEADRLIENAIALTADPSLGLTVGSLAPGNALQVLGHLMLSQPTLRDALATLKRYSVLLADGLVWELREQGEHALLTLELVGQGDRPTRGRVDHVLALLKPVVLHFAPTGASLDEVHLQHAAPSYAARYSEVFGCPARFEQHVNALVFARAQLDRVQLHADELVRELCTRTAERLLAERMQSRDLVERVRTLLRYERDLSHVSLERIATTLGLTKRALRRKLGAEGSAFQTLVAEARCRVACEAMRQANMSVEQTSALLGFSDTSSFYRAFKRWTGRTPAQFGTGAELAPTPPA